MTSSQDSESCCVCCHLRLMIPLRSCLPKSPMTRWIRLSARPSSRKLIVDKLGPRPAVTVQSKVHDPAFQRACHLTCLHPHLGFCAIYSDPLPTIPLLFHLSYSLHTPQPWQALHPALPPLYRSAHKSPTHHHYKAAAAPPPTPCAKPPSTPSVPQCYRT